MKPLGKCAKEYAIGSVEQPKHAKYALYYWGYVRFFRSLHAASRALDNLSWFEQQDAVICDIK